MHTMKTIVLVSLLCLAACKSATAVIDKHDYICEPGQDLGIAAGFDPGTRMGETAERLFLVEVSNNSRNEVTVTSVRVDPGQRYRGLTTAYEKTDVTIPEGEDHTFSLKASPFSLPSPSTLGPSGTIDFMVTVKLSNGDTYRCPFAGEVR
jgi:hypothetical protein